jgi:MFS family permease
MIRSRRGLVGFLSAEAVSLTGTRLSMLALPWFVLNSSGSPARTGLVAFAEMAPYVIAKALGGPVIDRVGPKRVSVVADSTSALIVACVPLLHAAGWLPYPGLLFLVAMAGMVRGPGDAAKATLVPSIAEAAGMPLDRVTGLYGVTDRLAATVGAASGGVLIAWLGPFLALYVDAGTFAVSAALIASTVRQGCRAEGADDGGYVERLLVGWDFLRRDRLLRAIAVMVCATNLIDAGLSAVILPMWGQAGHGPVMIGVVWGAFGVAAVVAASVAASIGHRLPRRMTFLVAFLVAGAPRILVLALDAPLEVVLCVWVAAGLGAGLINPLLGATMMERIPRPLLGRVTALFGTLAWAGIPIGGPVAGLLVVAFGLEPTIVISAIGYFIATTLPGLQPEWHQMDRAPVSGAADGYDANPEPRLGVRVREVERVS